MAGITYGLADFVTGGPILDLPVMAGASWSAALGRPDALECSISLRDPAALKLDLRSASEPVKTAMVARTDDDVILAWGLVKPRSWDEDSKVLTLTASGVRSSYFGKTIIGPATARTAALVTNGTVNAGLNTTLANWSLGTIGKKLIAQRLAWPGSPTFQLPPDEAGVESRTDLFSGLKTVEKALNEITESDGGPDFAFDAQRASDGLSLIYQLRHGSTAQPRIGTAAGTWSLGGQSPITELKIEDDADDMSTAGWMSGGKQAGSVILSRVLRDSMVANGYPPLDLVDTSQNDVATQAELDRFNRANVHYSRKPDRSLSFTVRADAQLSLGEYRPGDTVKIDVPDDHPWVVGSFEVRITSIAGDERGKEVKIGCVLLDA